MKKLTFIMSLCAILILSACGNSTQKSESKKDSSTKKIEKKDNVEMTIEKASKLKFEEASLLMNKYWSQFKGKEYAEVKDLFAKYEEEQLDLFRKFGVSTDHNGFDQQTFIYWVRDHRKELKEYRTKHPELDFYKIYPDYKDALVKCYHFDEAKWKDK